MTQPRLRLHILAILIVALLLAGSPVVEAAPSQSAAQQATTLWTASAVHDGIAYFAFASPRRIERFRLSDATWLATISLPTDYILVENPPSALAVDADGIFVAFGRASYKLALDGTGAIALPSSSSTITGLHTTSSHIYTVSSGGLMSISKATRQQVATSSYFDQIGGTTIAPGRGRIYGRSQGVSPADILQVVLNADGTLGALTDSPYHGDYPSGTKAFVFPDESRVTDTSGIVYNAGNLTYSGSFGGAVDALAFYGDLPIILRGTTLIAYTSNLLETGRYTMASTANTLALGGETIYVFRPAGARGVTAEAIPLSNLGSMQPGAPIDARGLTYTPEQVFLSPNGIIYLLSRANRSIFRWSLTERGYLPAIPLREAPDYMAYAAPTNRLYLSYPGGLITQIRIDEGLAEKPLVNAPATPCGLGAAEQYLFVCSPTGAWGTHIIYSPEGALIASKDWNYVSLGYTWSSTNRRMYFLRDAFSPNDLHAEAIGADGSIGTMSETPYHDSTGITHPVRVSPDGSVVILGSGRVFNAIALTNAAQLSNTISDAAWGSNLFTIRAYNSATQLQRWSSGYTLDTVAALAGTPLRLFSIGGQLLAIMNRDGVPQFVLLDESFNQVFASPPDKAIRGLSATSSSPKPLSTPIQFQASVMAGSPVSYRWDFGDGQTAEGSSVSHTYAAIGRYTARVTAGNAANELSLDLAVEVTEPPIPILYVAPGEISFNAVIGQAPPAARQLTISHNGLPSLGWSAQTDVPWLQLSQTTGMAPATPDLSVNLSGLGAGTYTGTVTIKLSDARAAPKQVVVTLSIAAEPPPPALTVAPGSLIFEATTGAANPGTQTISINHNGPASLAWSAEVNQPWLSLNATNGLAPATLSVQSHTEGLAPGIYTGAITVRLADQRVAPQTVPVTLVLQQANKPSMTLVAQPGLRGIRLTWTAPRQTGVARYRILRGPAGAELKSLADTRDTHYFDDDPKLTGGTTYCYSVQGVRANGDMLAYSPAACTTFGRLALWVPDVWGAPGGLAVIPVNVANADGLRIAAADIWLDLDGRVIEPLRVNATPLSAGYTWSYGISGSGAGTRVRIAAFSNTSATLAGNGSLFWLVVRVRGATGDSSPLNLREYVAGVGGSTIYTPENLTSPVPMNLQSGALHVTTAYSLGDLNGNGTVEGVDAYIALQIAAGRITPTQQQSAAGDVNGNGEVDSADATLILYYAAHGRWAFESEAQIQSLPAARLQAFAALDATPVQLSLGAAAGRPGEQVTVTLSATGLTDWSGGQLVITYDPTIVSGIQDVQLSAGTGAFSLQYHDDTKGILTIALADDEAHSLTGELLSIRLTLAAGARSGAQSTLALADARLNDAYGRDFATSALARPVERSDGSLNIGYLLHLPLLR